MRTVTITKTLLKYAELSDKAKERAREKAGEWVDCDFNDFYAEHCITSAADAAKMLGIDIGNWHGKPAVYYSGFCSQGDGASFEGSYSYAPGSVKAIKREFPQEESLHRVADTLADLQRSCRYKLQANITQDGRYSHSGTMSISVFRSDGKDVSPEIERDLADALRAFADWIYSLLQSEWNYQHSEQAIAEMFEANEVEFDENGNRE
jgi:hypothetical protein